MPGVVWPQAGLDLDTLASTGHFNALLDHDGVVRSVPAVVEHEGQWHEAGAGGVALEGVTVPFVEAALTRL